MFIEVDQVPFDEFSKNIKSEKSIDIKSRVEYARKIQSKRFSKDTIKTNNEIKSSKIEQYCKLSKEAADITNLIFKKYKLSNRSYTKLLKMARTIADLDGSDIINSNHINESFSYRKAYYTYFE